jgi:dihydropteroate synthase type 2
MNSPVTRTAPLLPAGSPRIVGIVNITGDSFSDGGRYLDPAAALTHARRLRGDGADVIELGPAASHPGSAPVSAAQEQHRLAPVLDRLAADGIPVSVDSFRTETLRFAVSAGAAYLNDIHGFGDPGLYPVLAASHCRLVVMHAVQAAGTATRVVTDQGTVREGIRRFFTQRLAALEAAGIGRDRLIVDPGLGYFLGSTPGPSLTALAGIRELKEAFGVPVLVSPSRKSFLRALTGRDVAQSGSATLAAEIFAAWQGADYIRTHDVAATRDALVILAAIAREAGHARACPEPSGSSGAQPGRPEVSYERRRNSPGLRDSLLPRVAGTLPQPVGPTRPGVRPRDVYATWSGTVVSALAGAAGATGPAGTVRRGANARPAARQANGMAGIR